MRRLHLYPMFLLGSALLFVLIWATQVLPYGNDWRCLVAECRIVIEKPVPFDHNGCQYPDRSTNPPNGCDNSDPCDPATVKGGSGDCDE